MRRYDITRPHINGLSMLNAEVKQYSGGNDRKRRNAPADILGIFILSFQFPTPCSVALYFFFNITISFPQRQYLLKNFTLC